MTMRELTVHNLGNVLSFTEHHRRHWKAKHEGYRSRYTFSQQLSLFAGSIVLLSSFFDKAQKL